MSEVKELLDTVVDNGYCVGCGACAVVEESALSIRMDQYGRYQAVSGKKDLSNAQVCKVCPFSSKNTNEDVLGKQLFGSHCATHSRIGYYLTTYAGFVRQNKFRELGSSGGMGTWVLHELLDRGLVDGVIHVKERNSIDSDEPMFGFGVSFSKEEVQRGAKSRYYPIEMSQVLDFVKKNPGRYAFVGIPCFVKAVRLLMHCCRSMFIGLPMALRIC